MYKEERNDILTLAIDLRDVVWLYYFAAGANWPVQRDDLSTRGWI